MGIWISIGNPAYYGDYIPQERQEHTLLAALATTGLKQGHFCGME